MEEKKCSKCKEVKGLGEFNKRAASKDGLCFVCRVCDNKQSKGWHRSKLGLVQHIYSTQKSKSVKRGHPQPTYSKGEFVMFALNSPEFHILYDNWKASDYDKWLAPSFDRDNDYLGYSFENFNKWMPWKENSEKGCDDRKAGLNNKRSRAVVGINKITGDVFEFYSASEAERQLGIFRSSIVACCTKKEKLSRGLTYICQSAGGYLWEYKNQA